MLRTQGSSHPAPSSRGRVHPSRPGVFAQAPLQNDQPPLHRSCGKHDPDRSHKQPNPVSKHSTRERGVRRNFFKEEKHGSEKRVGNKRAGRPASAPVEGPCVATLPATFVAPQVAPHSGDAAPPQNKYGLLKNRPSLLVICLPRPPEIGALPLNASGQGTGVPTLSPACRGRSAHSAGSPARRVGGRRRPGRWRSGFAAPAPRPGRLFRPRDSGSTRRPEERKTPRNFCPRFPSGGGGGRAQGRLQELGDLEAGPRKPGPGVALSSRAGAAQPTFREGGRLPPT